MEKPSSNIEEIMSMWAEDSKISPFDLSNASINTANLHSKYLNILTHHNLIVKKLLTDYAKLRMIKTEYYRGDYNGDTETLKRLGYEPLNKKIMKPDIEMYLDADDELTKILLKKVIHEEITEFCKAVIKALNSRTYEIGNAIKWNIFQGGGL